MPPEVWLKLKNSSKAALKGNTVEAGQFNTSQSEFILCPTMKFFNVTCDFDGYLQLILRLYNRNIH